MDITVFEPDHYLRRIAHCGSVRLTHEGLAALHHAQLSTIPFENFDIHLGRGISLDPAAVFTKLVHNLRGGYCFELNGLFLMALQYFGFNARPLLARVHRNGIPMGRGHQLSLVTIKGQQWISDVGFGSWHLPAPLPLETGYTATLDGQSFRLTDAREFGIMLQTLQDGLWQDMYSFDQGHVCPADIAYANHVTSTYPESLFTCARVAAIPIPGGRVSLLDRTLKKTGQEGVQDAKELPEGQAYLDALKLNFGIDLDVPYEKLSPVQTQPVEPQGSVV